MSFNILGELMNKNEVQSVVHATLAVIGQLADRTRTPADNLLIAILKSNESRLVEAIVTLVQNPDEPLTASRVTASLAAVGIQA